MYVKIPKQSSFSDSEAPDHKMQKLESTGDQNLPATMDFQSSFGKYF